MRGFFSRLLHRDDDDKLRRIVFENKKMEARLWLATARNAEDGEVRDEATRRARESASEARRIMALDRLGVGADVQGRGQ